jgi:outer membrane protein OmpA-like peptidoglycan-associated protein
MRLFSIAVLAGGLSVLALSGAWAQGATVASLTTPQRSYMVFFDEGSNALSPTAVTNVRNAARVADSAYTIRLHGDDKRVAAVKAELVRQGIRDDMIVTMPAARTLHRTDDGLKDPASRRVEIRF